jgi:hypothetical protein
MAVYLLPTVSVLALAAVVARAVSVRVVWRDAGRTEIERRLDEPV